MKEKQYWTMEELSALTETVQSGEVEYGNKSLAIQWCELTEAEEPKMSLPDDDLPEDEKNAKFAEMGQNKVVAMIIKANDMNPDGVSLTQEVWDKLPSTVKYSVSNVVLGGAASDFQSG